MRLDHPASDVHCSRGAVGGCQLLAHRVGVSTWWRSGAVGDRSALHRAALLLMSVIQMHTYKIRQPCHATPHRIRCVELLKLLEIIGNGQAE